MGVRYVDYSRYATRAAAPAAAGSMWGDAEACAPAPAIAACVVPASGWEDARAAAGPWAASERVVADPAASDRTARGTPPGRSGALAAFWLLYESRDRRLSLFETRDGHLAAVDPARLV